MSEPAPPARVVVYSHRGGKSDPPDPPPYARPSKIYGDATSLLHSDFTGAHGVDREAVRWRVDQLARLAPTLQSALVPLSRSQSSGT